MQVYVQIQGSTQTNKHIEVNLNQIQDSTQTNKQIELVLSPNIHFYTNKQTGVSLNSNARFYADKQPDRRKSKFKFTILCRQTIK